MPPSGHSLLRGAAPRGDRRAARALSVRELAVPSPLRDCTEFAFGVVLRGAPAALLWRPLLALGIPGALFLVAGSLRFRACFAAG